VQVLVKAVPDMTYVQLEKEFRERDYNVYLIAMEKDIEATQTIVNIQGKIGCKFAVFYFLSDKPSRPNMKERWPKSPEENLERLEDAGVPMDSGVVKCNNVSRNIIFHVGYEQSDSATNLDIQRGSAHRSEKRSSEPKSRYANVEHDLMCDRAHHASSAFSVINQAIVSATAKKR
jgi:hypothetical protein